MVETTTCFDSQGIGIAPSKELRESEDDALLAKELNSLTMEEREKVYDEVGSMSSYSRSDVGIVS